MACSCGCFAYELPILALRRAWHVQDANEPTGPLGRSPFGIAYISRVGCIPRNASCRLSRSFDALARCACRPDNRHGRGAPHGALAGSAEFRVIGRNLHGRLPWLQNSRNTTWACTCQV